MGETLIFTMSFGGKYTGAENLLVPIGIFRMILFALILWPLTAGDKHFSLLYIPGSKMLYLSCN